MSKQIDGEKMRQLAELIKKKHPGLGFALITFEFGSAKMGNYISNADRISMIRGLEEILERLKLGKDFPTPEDN